MRTWVRMEMQLADECFQHMTLCQCKFVCACSWVGIIVLICTRCCARTQPFQHGSRRSWIALIASNPNKMAGPNSNVKQTPNVSARRMARYATFLRNTMAQLENVSQMVGCCSWFSSTTAAAGTYFTKRLERNMATKETIVRKIF